MKKPFAQQSQPKQQPVAVVYREIATLKADPRNPRTHTPRQVRQIARSIESFGFNVPILVDATLKVIAGHGRLIACQQLGWREVPTIALEHLSAAQVKAFAIADNRLTENSRWDEQLLAAQLQELSVVDLDFSFEATGFGTGEIDLGIESLSSNVETGRPRTCEMPHATNGPAVSRVGDSGGSEIILKTNGIESSNPSRSAIESRLSRF